MPIQKKTSIVDDIYPTPGQESELKNRVRQLRREFGDVMTREQLKQQYVDRKWGKWADSKLVKNLAVQYRLADPFLFVLSVFDANTVYAGPTPSKHPGIIQWKQRAVDAYRNGKSIQSPLEPFLVPPPTTKFTPRKVDWTKVLKEAAECGAEGEKWLVSILQSELRSLGRDDLAARVDHVSVTKGDGTGYDILSFDPHDNEIYVEVKTTKSSAETPFYLTKNEIGFARDNEAKYRLYRIFDWDGTAGKFWRIEGERMKALTLEPILYRAWL